MKRAFLVFLIFSLLSEVRTAQGLLSENECKEEKRIGLQACSSVIYFRNPSAACCYRVRVSHVDCVCPVITPRVAALVDVNRFIRIIQGCGRPVPRHFKCGSITTP